MKNKRFNIKPLSLALLLAGIGIAQSSYAVDLVAIDGQWSPDGGTTQIPMWGFAADTGQACNSLPAWTVGPPLTDAHLTGPDLVINLRNCLSEPVSIIIPGQPATFTPVRSGNRVTAFTSEAAANGGMASYIWTGVKDGTYLYQSGSHPAKQVQMGLYGALTIKGVSYPEAHDEVTLLYSEIDPVLHSPPTAATPLGYNPRHFLVNGLMSQSVPNAGDTNHPMLLRFLNAGLDFHVPALNGSYMTLVAEDGNPYPFAKQQYSVNLAAGKTIDALWRPSAGDHVIYDRRGNGMVASLTVAAGTGQPIANDDSYPIGEGGVLNVASTGILGNDTDASLVLLTIPPASVSLVSSTSSGDLTLNADGSFIYTPNVNFNGTDSFTYRANNGTLDSNIASVSITVSPENDAPVADANGPYTAMVGVSVTLDGTASSDVDGDTLTYAWDFGDLSSGTGDMPSHTYTAAGTYTVNLVVNDGAEDSAVAATTVEVGVAVNTAPVAVEDSVQPVLRNSGATFINLTGNDSDADGNLKDGLGNVTNDDPASGSINITTGSTTTRGGTVSIVTNGVNYTPKRNFRGTDTFNYTVTDTSGDPMTETSNEVTVRVNVVRP